MRQQNHVGLWLFAIMLPSFAFYGLAAPTVRAADPTAARTPLFPFVVSYDAPPTLPDLSSTLRDPAGRCERVRTVDGHLATDTGPIRFWGTNLCFGACFPDRQKAERLAARLAWLGINCVRFHHMDAWDIWGKNNKKLTIDPGQRERLDYLIYQLKQRGIYVNLNLHVSRWLGDAEGFPHRQRRPKYDKGLGNFEPRMIDLQKQYARDLLTHRNPHTGFTYAKDPVVAFVEISNEDSLFTVWNWGDMDDLPEPYATTYRRLWNAWLRDKYGSTDRLGEAWREGSAPLGNQMLANTDFTGDWQKNWHLGRDDETVAAMGVESAEPGGAPVLKIEVEKQGKVAWHPQLIQQGFAVEAGKAYTLRLRMRSDAAREISVNCMMAHSPWDRLGLSAPIELTTEWRDHKFTFVPQHNDANARITLTSLKPGAYELASVSLRPGGILGLRPEEILERGNVAVLPRHSLDRTRQARHDFVDFLFRVERDYWLSLERYLKDELGVEALISGTQLSYSPVTTQARLDYIDAHAYWSHPHFPNRPWDRRDWWVLNRAMVNHPGGTLESLAARRVLGKGFTVSEYNHPFPNRYAAEGFPMLAGMAALQAWDGIFPFTYSHNDDFEPRVISGYFDIKSDPTRIVHMPACVALFVRGDMRQAEELVEVLLWPQRERELLHDTLTPRSLTADRFGLAEPTPLEHRVGIRLIEDRARPSDGASGTANGTPPAASRLGVPGHAKATRFVSDTGQMVWDVSKPDAGYFVVNTPRTKVFTGFVGGRVLELGRVKLRIGATRNDWATVSLVCRDGEGFDRSGRILVAATGWMQNSGAVPVSLGGERITLRDDWGEGPILCEGISAEIVLPVAADRVRLFPLDEAGARRDAVNAEPNGEGSLLRLSPETKTLWYEIEIR